MWLKGVHIEQRQKKTQGKIKFFGYTYALDEENKEEEEKKKKNCKDEEEKYIYFIFTELWMGKGETESMTSLSEATATFFLVYSQQ